MASAARPYVLLLLWLIGLVLLVLMVKAFEHEAGDGREQHCNRIARTEAAIEGTDREEAKAHCLEWEWHERDHAPVSGGGA